MVPPGSLQRSRAPVGEDQLSRFARRNDFSDHGDRRACLRCDSLHELFGMRGRCREEKLVVLAAVQREVPLVAARRAREGAVLRAHRQLVREETDADSAFLADVIEVPCNTVTHVDHCAGLVHPSDQRTLPDARRGAVAARPRDGRVRSARLLLQSGVEQQCHSRRGISHASRDQDEVTRRGARAQDYVPSLRLPEEEDVDEDALVRPGDIAAHDVHPERAPLFAEARVQPAGSPRDTSA